MSKHKLAIDNSQVPEGYKKTEVGVIPEDWAIVFLGYFTNKVGSGITPTGGARVYKDSGRPFIRSQNVGWGYLKLDDLAYIDEKTHQSFAASEIQEADVLLNITGASIGRSCIADKRIARGNVNQHVCIIRTVQNKLNSKFLSFFLLSEYGQKQIDSFQAGGNREGLNFGQIRSFKIRMPKVIEEQRAIAQTLSDVDGLIAALDKLIAKKRNIKTATMQELLTGKKRLPGFDGEWEVKTVEDIADCLDNIRVPLNESQRNRMKGNIPYCGANGILDYVNDFIVDDDIILMAEDGGYFDEFDTRPIAYRMFGKCWVNNHAHILKAKDNVSQGFLFYSLEHKDIRQFIASGTRTKLNKSEMKKIKIEISYNFLEQQAIASILSDMDAEIAALEKRRAKTKAMKQGMMQELLTGKTRLIDPNNP